MVKKKIKELKNAHNEKIGIIKKNHTKIDSNNIKEYDSDLKKIESLLLSQLETIKDLEDDYSYEDEGTELFEKEFDDHINKFKEKMEAELDVVRKFTNPFYDNKTRFDKYNEFTKGYEMDLIQKKSVIERLKEQLSNLKMPTIDLGKSFGKKKSINDKDVKVTKENFEVPDAPKEILATEKVETVEDDSEGNEVSKVSEETLIASLKNKNEIKEEYDVKTAVEDNSVKLKLEVKIVHNPDNTAWAFIYQKYYNVPDSNTYKSGQTKGYEKLVKLREEYLDKLYNQLSDLVMNKETYNDVKARIKECLEKDSVNIY
jgi:hypothetical protein